MGWFGKRTVLVPSARRSGMKNPEEGQDLAIGDIGAEKGTWEEN